MEGKKRYQGRPLSGAVGQDNTSTGVGWAGDLRYKMPCMGAPDALGLASENGTP